MASTRKVRTGKGKARGVASRATPDRTALTKARALIAEQPTMRPVTALRKSGVKSQRTIERLTKALAATRPSPPKGKRRGQAKEPARTGADDMRTRAQPEASGFADASRLMRHHAWPSPDSSGNGERPSLWSMWLRWSPMGMMLWQAAVVAEMFSRKATDPALPASRKRPSLRPSG